MSEKNPKSDKKNQESQNENGKVLNFPTKKNFGSDGGKSADSNSGSNSSERAGLRLVEPPSSSSVDSNSNAMTEPEMKSRFSNSTWMKFGLILAFGLGALFASQIGKGFSSGGRQIASADGSENEASGRDKKTEKALLEKVESNREPAEWSLNVVPKEDQFRHGYLRGNYQITHDLGTGLLMSVEYATPNDSNRAPRDFNELSREEFFARYASLWVSDYTGFEKIGASSNGGFVQETYKLKTSSGEVVLDFKLDSISRLIAIKRVEASR